MNLIDTITKMFRVVGSDVVWWSSQRKRRGTVAGNVERGNYRRIRFIHNKEATVVLAHRVSWMLHNGRELKADEIIDHIDGNPSNNSSSNLRIVTNSQNSRNRSKAILP